MKGISFAVVSSENFFIFAKINSSSEVASGLTQT